MRQHDQNHGRTAEPEESIWTVLPVALIVVLSVGVLTMGVLKSFRFGPSVGDVVVFQPSKTALSNEALQRVDVAATAIVGSDRRSCTLNPAMMAVDGGSLVVERSFNVGRPMLQVHWSGHRTNNGDKDCGRSADLLILPNDLLDLAGAAGGFGVSHKMTLSAQSFANVPTLLD